MYFDLIALCSFNINCKTFTELTKKRVNASFSFSSELDLDATFRFPSLYLIKKCIKNRLQNSTLTGRQEIELIKTWLKS